MTANKSVAQSMVVRFVIHYNMLDANDKRQIRISA